MGAVTGAAGDVYTLWWRETRSFFRSKLRIFSSFFSPLLWLVMMGYGIQAGLKPKIPGASSYIVYILPGVLGLSMLQAAGQGGMSIIQERDTGFLLEVLVAPVRRTSIALGKALGLTTRSLFRASLTIGVSFIIGLRFDSILEGVTAVLWSLLALTLLGVAIVTLGIAIAWKMDDIQTFSVGQQWLVMPLYILSGALYPLKGLPDWLLVITYVNPVTYGVDAMRHFLVGDAAATFPLWGDMAFLLVFCAASLLFAAWVMKRSDSD